MNTTKSNNGGSRDRVIRSCVVEVWTGRMTQWRIVREYASRRNAKRAIPALKEKLGTHELRWMDTLNK